MSDIYNTFLEASKDEGKGLLDATKELKEMTPLPMNTMLEKESKEAALSQKNKRDSMSTENVPPTTACKGFKYIIILHTCICLFEL